MCTAYLDRAQLPDAVEPLKDLVVQLAQQLQAVREQAGAQMANLAQQLAALRDRMFGCSSEVLHVGQTELWVDKVELPVPPPASVSASTIAAAADAPPSIRACHGCASNTI
jgi:hypothetical protein